LQKYKTVAIIALANDIFVYDSKAAKWFSGLPDRYPAAFWRFYREITLRFAEF
jgi:hypothetical protein